MLLLPYTNLCKAIFCRIAGLPFVCDIEDIKNGEMHGAELFTSMTIIAGKSSALTDADREMQEDATYQATLYQDLESGYDIGDTDDTSIVEVTRRAFDYPSLKVITENRGCDALGAKGYSSDLPKSRF